MRTMREYPRGSGGGSCVMHDDTITIVVEQFGSYSIVAEDRDRRGRLLERSTVQLSREEMLRIISDFHRIEEQARREIDYPTRVESIVSRMLTIFRE